MSDHIILEGVSPINLRRVVGSIALCFALTFGTASADYQPDKNVNVNLTVAPSLLQFGGFTGALSFAIQEKVHNVVTERTGQSIDHYYIMVYVNGNPLLAVDPMWIDYK